MNLIAAVDANWAIGNKGKLLISIPEDMKFFRAHTLGKTVIMGRRTLESFPNKKPLPDRRNIVLTRNAKYAAKGAEVVTDIDRLKEMFSGEDTADVYVIGGETVYRQMLSECDTAYITKIDFAYEADAYFPNLDDDPEWELVEESEEETYFNVCYTFCKYERKPA